MTRTTYGYARLSVDRDQVGLESQEAAITAYAKQRGWSLEPVIKETAAAYRRGSRAQRPKFQALIAGAAANPTGTRIIVWSLDRLVRDLEDFIDLRRLADAGAEILSTTGDIDLTTEAGRATAAILTSVKTLEVETLTKRIQNQKTYQKSQGRFLGNGRRTFGYTNSKKTREIVEEEKEALLTVYRNILNGASWSQEAARLNDAGILPPNQPKQEKGASTKPATQWTANNLSKTFNSPALRGILTYADGTTATAPWTPILTQDQVDEIARVREARRTYNGDPKLQSPASGLLTCGRCGARMRTQGARKITCPKCFNGIARPHVEALIEKITLISLRDYQPHNAEQQQPLDLSAEEQALERNAALESEGIITAAMRATGDREIQRKIESKQRAHRQQAKTIPAWMRDEETILSTWAQMTPQQQRTVMQGIFESIKIRQYQPQEGQPAAFDPERIEIHYRRR